MKNLIEKAVGWESIGDYPRESFTYTIDAIISRKFRHLCVKKFIIEYDASSGDDGVADGHVISNLPQMEVAGIYDGKEEHSHYADKVEVKYATGRMEEQIRIKQNIYKEALNIYYITFMLQNIYQIVYIDQIYL